MPPSRLWPAVVRYGFPALMISAVIVASLATEKVTPSLQPAGSQIEMATGWADESSCIQCHEQARTFAETGHAQTLHRAENIAVRALLDSLNNTEQVRAEGTSISRDDQRIRVLNERGPFRSIAELSWCFGSGKHARTWVATLPDSYGMTDLLEFRWSWYHDIDGFDVTTGQTMEPGTGYYSHLGVLHDHPKARRCFGCHATVLPIEAGAIDEPHVRAGVTCQRCHGPRQSHVFTQGKTGEQFWSSASRDESVARCAECHRHPDEQLSDTIRPDNPEIARFQPIGLSQSACFQQSQMTCLTCHDPHRPMAAQNSGGIWQCMQCHDGTHRDKPECGAHHREDCLRCHMPKVKLDRPLQFTDHWIRVRESDAHP